MATTQTGDNGNNRLQGTNKSDRLLGEGGNDRLIGLDEDDTLDGGTGDDVLDGGTGRDQLIGGAGDDLYILREESDRIEEKESQGIDTIRASVSINLDAFTNVEDLRLFGSRTINGTGNSRTNVIWGNKADNTLQGLSGDDRLYGGTGNDRLDGGVGNDVLVGNPGNDTFVVDSRGDLISEAANEGIDTVESSVDFSLTDAPEKQFLENLTLTGTAINATGNGSDNLITGNRANNVLKGEAGADQLIGGAGRDTLTGGTDQARDLFIYGNGTSFRRSDFGVDRITDFDRNADAIVLSKKTFGLSNGLVLGDRNQFQSVANDAAAAANPARIVFSQATGTLFYNPNGSRSGYGDRDASGSFLILNQIHNLGSRDFILGE